VDSVDTLPPARARERTRQEDADPLVHGRYRLRERLGAGGFGVVWRAHDELLHREVALKRIPLPPEESAPPEELPLGERAGREALAAARLGHPAIVALYEAYIEGDAFYLVSELVRGQTLARLIAADELEDEEILQIGASLAEALAHAHARGVIHRDVKPQNVLVPRPPGEHDPPAKLTDFGGARLAGEDVLTRTGETLGTLAYMAPEQCEGSAVDERADVYSLALVLYEALAGANPLRGRTPAATARRIGRPVPSLASRRPDLSSELCGGIDHALAVDPRERATLAELRDALAHPPAARTRPRHQLLGARTRRLRTRDQRRDSAEGAASADSATLPARRFARSATRRELSSVKSPYAPAPERGGPRRYALQPRPPDRDRRDALEPDAVGSDALEHHAHGADAAGAAREPGAEHERSRATPLALPRAIWVGLGLALAVFEAVHGRPGLALVIAALAAPLLLLGPRPDLGWATAALAPLLGVIGLAGAYPAIVGQARHWPRRAALGALGYWWLTLAAALLADGAHSARLWLAPAAGTPPRALWERSLQDAATHVIAPTLVLGVLLGACLWGLAAAILPWLVRGRHVALDVVAAVAWSALLLAAAPSLDSGLSPGAAAPLPRGAVLGAILAGAIAIGARALRGPA
jgi:eukaryotic-like serine/threonine-protein kinase